jgi:TnpA family transposase
MESSNGANSVIAYGKGGEIASDRRDRQEMFVLCLRILRSALVYVFCEPVLARTKLWVESDRITGCRLWPETACA